MVLDKPIFGPLEVAEIASLLTADNLSICVIAALLNVDRMTLAKWRENRTGPPFIRLKHGVIVYPREAFQRYLKASREATEAKALARRPRKQFRRIFLHGGRMNPAEKLTVEEVKARVSEKAVVIRVSSKIIEDGVGANGKTKFKAVPKLVSVAREAEIKPELIISGPKRRGAVNVYLGIDGRKHYFACETGAALGSQLHPKERTRNPMKLIPPSGSDPAPGGTDRRYLR